MNIFLLIQLFEIIAAIIASVFYKKYAESFLKYFLAMLWIIVFVEGLVWSLKRNGVVLQNNFIYNVLNVLQNIFYFVLYYRNLRSKLYRKWIIGFMASYMAAVVINFMWIQKLTITAPFNSYTFTIGAIFLIITIGLFLVEILNTEKILYFTRYLMFWISIGLLIFYAGIIPFMIGINLLPSMLSSDSLTIAFIALNFFMYASFSIGFIISHKYTE